MTNLWHNMDTGDRIAVISSIAFPAAVAMWFWQYGLVAWLVITAGACVVSGLLLDVIIEGARLRIATREVIRACSDAIDRLLKKEEE